MITANEAMERRWQEFQNSPVASTVEVRWDVWGWVDIINTPALLFRLACIGWDLQLPPVASNGDSPSRQRRSPSE